MRRIGVVIAALLPVTVLARGPFGFEMGESLDKLNAYVKLTKKSENYSYVTTSPPSPPSDFKKFTLHISPKHGLCSVVAETEPADDTPDGKIVLKKFFEMQDALKRQYDKLTVHGSSASTVPRSKHFMWGLATSVDKTWWSYWVQLPGVDMPDNIDGIELQAKATPDGKRGYLSLKYDFTNNSRCLSEKYGAAGMGR